MQKASNFRAAGGHVFQPEQRLPDNGNAFCFSSVATQMNRTALAAAFSLILLGPVRAADPVDPQEQQLAAVVKEIQAQQAQIAANQAKIEEKMAGIAEAVRIARIYVSRAGH